jgi:hypothetical protein
VRRPAVITLVAVIGLGALIAPPAAARQPESGWRIGVEGERWEGVGRPEPPTAEAMLPPPVGDLIMEPYAVFFSEDYAAVPEMTEFTPEFMVVVVQKGNFALDVADTESGIVVFPAEGQPIPMMNPRKDDPPYYQRTDPVTYIQNPSGGDCTLACPIPADSVIQTKPGDRIVAREGALCVWCLLNSNFDPGNAKTEYDDQGLLEVFALLPAGTGPNRFSWIQDWESNQKDAATPSVSQRGGPMSVATNSEPTLLAWAFNPQARCRGG